MSANSALPVSPSERERIYAAACHRAEAMRRAEIDAAIDRLLGWPGDLWHALRRRLSQLSYRSQSGKGMGAAG